MSVLPRSLPLMTSIPLALVPTEERPRERLARLGPSALSDVELVAIHLGSGTRGQSALELASALLVEWGGVSGLAQAGIDELARRPGIGLAKACRLVSAFALADRAQGLPTGRLLRSSADIADVAIPIIGRARTEQVLLLIADQQQRVRRVVPVTTGNAAGSTLPVREVLALTLRHDGVSFAVAHNHPSGSVEPSEADRSATRRLTDAAAEVGLRFLDHVVVSSQAWRSITADRPW